MPDTDQDALAAEYVLGTLSAGEREQAEALLAADPAFAEVVRQWERRLGELNVMVEAVEPPPAVWDKIKTEIGVVVPSEPAPPAPPSEATAGEANAQPGVAAALAALAQNLSPSETGPNAETGVKPETKADDKPAAEAASPSTVPQVDRNTDVADLTRRLAQWRSVALAGTAVAVLLAIYVAAAQFVPGLVPLRRGAAPPAPAQAATGSRLVGALQQGPVAPAFLITVDSQSRTLTVRRIVAAPETGRSYELWLVAKRFPAPRSLGVVGDPEFTQRPLPANVDVATLGAASYEVSLEPAGGSPSGVPSGPILFTGRLVESLPATAPPG